MIVNLDSGTEADLADYLSLKDVALRSRLEPAQGLYMAESLRVIERALTAGHRPRSVLVTKRWLTEILDLLAAHQVSPAVRVLVASDDLAQQIAGFKLHRGALAAMERPAPPRLATVLGPQVRRVLILEDIVDHTNVGAAFRSAAALGYDAVLVTPSCADPLYRRAVRVSMGAVFQIPWTRLPTWPDLSELHEHGFTVAALALSEQAQELRDFAASLHQESRLALVVGTEGDGLGSATLAAADQVVRIDMQNGIDSLNVAAACALACWATARPPVG